MECILLLQGSYKNKGSFAKIVQDSLNVHCYFLSLQAKDILILPQFSVFLQPQDTSETTSTALQ